MIYKVEYREQLQALPEAKLDLSQKSFTVWVALG